MLSAFIALLGQSATYPMVRFSWPYEMTESERTSIMKKLTERAGFLLKSTLGPDAIFIRMKKPVAKISDIAGASWRPWYLRSLLCAKTRAKAEPATRNSTKMFRPGREPNILFLK